MLRVPWTQDEIYKITSLHSEGKNARDISAILGRSHVGTIKKIRDLFGVQQKHTSWTMEESERLKDLFSKGLGLNEIATILGRTFKSVSHRLQVLNLRNWKRVRWTPEENSRMVSLFSEGKRAPEVAKILGRRVAGVLSNKLEVMEVLPPRKQAKTNIDFFRTITKESAYVLGLIVTDGCVYDGDSVMIHQSHDCGKELLRQVQRFTGGSIFNGHKIDENHMSSNRLVMYGKELVGIMKSYGITERKTYTVDFPDMSDELVPHFMRGVIDGDGCIYLSSKPKAKRIIPDFSVSFVSASQMFISGVIESMRGCGIDAAQVTLRHNAYCLSWATARAIKFCDWIYRDSTPQTRLDRKFRKFIDYLTIRSNATPRKGLREGTAEEAKRMLQTYACPNLYIGSTG